LTRSKEDKLLYLAKISPILLKTIATIIGMISAQSFENYEKLMETQFNKGYVDEADLHRLHPG
jgi:hypothetical protein